MDCLDDLKVLAYLERRLARTAMTQVRAHLDVCRSCVQLVVALCHSSVEFVTSILVSSCIEIPG